MNTLMIGMGALGLLFGDMITGNADRKNTVFLMDKDRYERHSKDIYRINGKEKTFKDLNDLEKAIKDYINWYNTDRVCKKLKGLSPINFRKQALNSVSMT